MADDPVTVLDQDAKNSASDRKRRYAEGTNATQVRQSARGKDGINLSLVAGVAGLMKVGSEFTDHC